MLVARHNVTDVCSGDMVQTEEPGFNGSVSAARTTTDLWIFIDAT